MIGRVGGALPRAAVFFQKSGAEIALGIRVLVSKNNDLTRGSGNAKGIT
jgi:hypothetical protein